MIVDERPEPMPLAQEIFRSVGDLVICGEVICALVVFEDA